MLYMGEGNGTPLQYSCLENHMDRGAWWAAVHGVLGLDMTWCLNNNRRRLCSTWGSTSSTSLNVF